jgi:hypothetical protein
MFKRVPQLAFVCVVASLMLAPAIAQAAGTGGNGPWDAFAVDGTWQQLNPGQTHWYKFMTDGEEGRILVQLNAEPEDGAAFSVRTAEQARIFQETGDEEACGCSSPDEFIDADTAWAGEFNIPGTYYVAVKHTGRHDAPVFYALDVSGKGVLKPATAPRPAAAPAAEKAPMAEVSAFHDWMGMEGSHSHWETFTYEGDDTNVEIALDTEPDQGAVFSVWTPDQVREYGQGLKVEPVGRGTPNDDVEADLFWSGRFAQPGTYYVLVEHRGEAPSYCKLTLQGKDVWH